MDIVESVLRVTQLGSPVLCRSVLHAPWGMAIGSNRKTAVHFVMQGSCWFRSEQSPGGVHLQQGDVVLVGGGVDHSLADSQDSPTRPWEAELAAARLKLADGANPKTAQTVLMCAAYELQRGSHPLLGVLPDFFVTNIETVGNNRQLRAVVELLAAESQSAQPGSDILVPRMIDSLLVLVLRAWLQSQANVSAGWLGALIDPQLAKALALIHQTPEQEWTVETLARRSGLSRAAFARKFCDLVGEPPLKYVTRWRMNLAAKLLSTTSDSIDAIARQVGYESATAFSKAFNRFHCVSPGRYRDLGDENLMPERAPAHEQQAYLQ